MARSAKDRLITSDELLALPDDGHIHELLHGCLISEPLSGVRHGRVTLKVAFAIQDFLRTRRLGVLLGNDTGFVLAHSPDTVRGPDIAFVSMDRFRAVADITRHFPGPPDLAIEVLSPFNKPGEIHAKVADYLAAGTRLVWVVDPQKSRVIVYRTLLSPRILTNDDELDGEDVLPGFTAIISDLFAI